MKIMRDIAHSTNREIPITFFKNETQTNSLAIVLPGVGYTVQAPLLHYSNGMFLNKGYDVLQVNYRYQPETVSSISGEELTTDVQSAISKISSNHSYSNYTIIAKSLGTIPLAYLLAKPDFQHAKAIWLTPLLKRADVSNALLTGTNKGLCIIGDQDIHYIPEIFEKIKRNCSITSMLITGANHSLEDDTDMIKSLDVLKEIMMTIKDF